MDDSILNVGLESDNSCLKKREHTELLNMSRIEALLNSDMVWEMQLKNDKDEKNEKYNFNREYFEKMIDEAKCVDGRWYMENVFYKGSKNLPDCGRVYPIKGKSLGPIPRQIRHFLCEDQYYDVDIVNCFGSLCLEKCREWGLNCPCMEEYCNRRGSILQDIMDRTDQDRDFAKKIFILIMFGGSWKKHFREHNVPLTEVTEFILHYEEEVKNIQNFMMDRYKDNLYEKLTEHQDIQYKKRATFMFNYFALCEVEILKVCVSFVMDKNWDINKLVLTHDGFMIPRYFFKYDDYTINDFINELNFEMLEEAKLPNIKFKHKLFDEANTVHNILQGEGIDYDYEYSCPFYEKYGLYKSQVDEIVGTDDNSFADAFHYGNQDNFITTRLAKDLIIFKLNEYGVFKRIDNEAYCSYLVDYMKDLIVQIDKVEKSQMYGLKNWNYSFFDYQLKALEAYYRTQNINPTNGGLSLLGQYATNYDIKCMKYKIAAVKRLEKKIELNKKNRSNKIKNQASKKQVVNRSIEMFFNQDFLDKANNNDTLLGFDDGVLDLENMIFRTANPKNGEYVTMSCGYMFRDAFENPGKYEDRKQELIKILKDIFPSDDVYTFWYKATSRSLVAKANKEEISIFCRGPGRDGKGLQIELMKYALGQYCSRIKGDYFQNANKPDTQPELQAIEKARWVYVDEPEKEKDWIADIYKDVTGNGEIEYRLLWSNDMRKFIFPPLWEFSNHFPSFDSDTTGESMIMRIVAVELPYTFISIEDYKSKVESFNSKGLPIPKKYKVADLNLKKKIQSGYFNEAMMLILIDHYKLYIEEGLDRQDFPEKVKQSTTKMLLELNEDIEWIQKTIEPTEDSIFIDIKELHDLWREETGTKKGKARFTKKLKEALGEDYYEKEAKNTSTLSDFRALDLDNYDTDKPAKSGDRVRGSVRARYKKSFIEDMSSDSEEEY